MCNLLLNLRKLSRMYDEAEQRSVICTISEWRLEAASQFSSFKPGVGEIRQSLMGILAFSSLGFRFIFLDV